jgi:hypothetical protein
LQAGSFIFDSTSLAETVSSYFTNLTSLLDREPELPNKLYFQPLIVDIPGQGTTFIVSYTWNGPSTADEQLWRAHISTLAPTLIASTVQSTTLVTLIAEITAMASARLYQGALHSVSLRGLRVSPDTVAMLAKHGERMRGRGVLFCMHMLHGRAVTPPFPPNLHRNREVHYVVEVIGFVASPAGAEEGRRWAEDMVGDLRTAEEVMEGTYLSVTWKDDVDLKKIYGSKLARLMELKRKKDPTNVFQYARPQLPL